MNAAAALPRATLRLQLHADYTLDHALEDLEYFARLGVSHLYLSPVSRSRKGSMHGYDVVDHTSVDPDRGGEVALRRLAVAARRAGIGLLLDIVPNHMATDPSNAWWWDVLKHGRESQWAEWFDIEWDTAALPGKVLAPFLAKPYQDALQAGDIRLEYSVEHGLHVTAHGVPYPLSPDFLEGLGQRETVAKGSEADWATVLAAHDPVRPGGVERLDVLLSQQHYRLAWWRLAASEINWRRFFEVSELIGVCVERDDAFAAVHALPLRLYEEGLIDGLRIDHVDGLAHPLSYCRRLHAAMDELRPRRPEGLKDQPPWIVVEKILAPEETLDERWAVSGTTGYDFAADVGALLHDEGGAKPLFSAWSAWAGDAREPGAWLVDARREMLDRHFIVERGRLLEAILRFRESAALPGSDDDAVADGAAVTRALDALLCNYPTYRSYVGNEPRAAQDQRWFDRALRGARDMLEGEPEAQAMLPALDAWLGGRAPESPSAHELVRRFQQLTPPLAAKALEDTVFYRYGCLLSRNEVGSDPDVFALSVQDFHQSNARRAEFSPAGLLATATHDHKRGEDVRARLAVLSEIPDEWIERCRASFMRGYEESGGPATAFRYMLLQMLVGAWPPELSTDDAQGLEDYFQRLRQWGEKALREGKQISSWFEPDVDQEAASLSWLDELAPGGERHDVLQGIEAFVRRIELAGVANGLLQTALRMTCPGIPDLYQGTEFPDFSLVDPDNRRPVDFNARSQALQQASDSGSDTGGLRAPLAAQGSPASAWTDGRIKQALIAVLLQLRREHAGAFAGDYRALQVQGDASVRGQLVAFSRGEDIVVIAGVKCAAQLHVDSQGALSLPAGHWADARLSMPGPPGVWYDVLRGRRYEAGAGKTPVADLLDGFPLAVLSRNQG